jgi:amino acid transporter
MDEPVADLPGELVAGAQPGGGYVRVRRETLGPFRASNRGHLVATEEASEPLSPLGRWVERASHLLLGRPLESEAIESERLSVLKAMPILSSDALSSVAYGPEAALAVLAGAGAGALFWNIPIAIAVALLMLVVTISYRQVIIGYQGGGGSYAVARANLGTVVGLIAAAALLIDYVLTVSVSVSAGVSALVSAFGGLSAYQPLLAIVIVALLLIGNLRGVREAGVLFAVPTYLFIFVILVLVAAGLVRAALGGAPTPGRYAPIPAHQALTPLIVLAAFASGCSSMTGIEAVSNGVPGFREPRARNAIRTLTVLGALLILLFISVEALDVLYVAEPHPSGNPTVLSEIAAAVFTGPARFLYYVVQFSTTLVLVLAANTSFNGFPRLCALLARDDFMPHRFSALGNRLVYSSAIVFLAVVASLVVLAFAGNTDTLINFYALGVFTAFALAQAAMTRQWWVRREAGWQRGVAINGTGALVTALVDAVIIVSKAPRGAWIILVLIPLLVLGFMTVQMHYRRVERQRRAATVANERLRLGPTLVPVLRWDRAAADALAYARFLSDSVVALVAARGEPPDGLAAGVGARPVAGPGGVEGVVGEIDAAVRAADGAVVTVVLPEEARSLWQQFLVRPDLVRLKLALLRRPNVVAASFPEFMGARGEQVPETGAGHVAFVPVSRIDAVTVRALRYAAARGAEVVAIHVIANVEEVGNDERDRVPEEFQQWSQRVEGPRPRLVVIESPYRAVVPPMLSYVRRWREANPTHVCTIVIPELVDTMLWTLLLHNHRAFWLKTTLLRLRGIGIADVTFHVRDAEE